MQAGRAGLFVQLRPALLDQFPELRHRSGRRAVLVAPVRQRHGLGDSAQFQRPVQSGVAAAEYQQAPAAETRGILYAVMKLPAFQGLGAVQAKLAGLKRAHAAGEKKRFYLK